MHSAFSLHVFGSCALYWVKVLQTNKHTSAFRVIPIRMNNTDAFRLLQSGPAEVHHVQYAATHSMGQAGRRQVELLAG